MIEECRKKNMQYVKSEVINQRRYIYCTCNIHSNEPIQRIRYSHFKKSVYGCKYCAGKVVTTERLKSDSRISDNIEIIGEYIDDGTKIKCKCKVCSHIWYATPNKLKQGRSCPNCKAKNIGDKLRMTQDEFEKRVKAHSPHIDVIGKYERSNQNIKCYCNIHDYYWYGYTDNLQSGRSGCPICNSSIGEKTIASYLDLKNIEYIREFTFDNCKYKAKLRFDFYLPQYNMVIEYQGEQHYFPVNFKGGDNTEYLDEFKNNQIRDKIKKEYCKNNNIIFIEIPYWSKDQIELILNNVLESVETVILDMVTY